MGLIQDVKASVSIDEIAHRLGIYTETRNGKLLATCPFHEDSHPSMELNVAGKYQGRYICRVCPKDPGEGDVIDLVKRYLGLESDVAAARWIRGEDRREPIPPPRPQKVVNAPVLNDDLAGFALEAYLERTDYAYDWMERRGIARVADQFKLGSTDALGFPQVVLPRYWDHDSGRVSAHKNFLNRLIIPYLQPDGEVNYVNARALGEQKPKYLKAQKPHESGQMPPYLLDLVLDSGAEDIWASEGEVDCLSLYACMDAISACALPGVSSLNDMHLPKFQGRRVFIVMDNDEAGRTARADLERRLLPFARQVYHAYVPHEFNDVNEMLVKRGRKWCAGFWEGALRKAVREVVRQRW